MNFRKQLCALLAFLFFVPAWFFPASQPLAATNGGVTFKIPVPDEYADHPMVFLAYKVKMNGSYVLRSPVYENENRYGMYPIDISIEAENANVWITVPELDWSVADAFPIVIATQDFVYSYRITKDDVGNTIVVTADESYVPVSVEIPFAGEGLNWSMKLCFTDSDGMVMNCIPHVPYGVKVPAGNYNIQVTASDNQAGYGLFKRNYPLTQSNSTVLFSENDVAKIIATMNDGQNGLNLTSITPRMISGVGYFNEIPAQNKSTVYLSKQVYDQIVFNYETADGWAYEYKANVNEISKETHFVFSSNLALSITGLKESYEPGRIYYWADNIRMTDAQGNELLDISPPSQTNHVGEIQFINNETEENFTYSFGLPLFRGIQTPDVEGNYTMKVSFPDIPVPVEPVTEKIVVQKQEIPEALKNPVVIEAVVKEGTVSLDKGALQELKDGSWVFVDLQESQTDHVVVRFTAEQIKFIRGKHADISISTKDGAITIPYGELSGNANVNVEINKLPPVEGALSLVYDFNIKQGDQYLHQFNEPIQLSFKVDESKVEDPDKLKVFYFNNGTNQWENVGGTYLAGYVLAKTQHFSTYAVFNVDASTKGAPDLSGANTSGNPDGQETGSREASGQQAADTSVNELPDTATNIYNWLLLGGLSVMAGLILTAVRIKKQRG